MVTGISSQPPLQQTNNRVQQNIQDQRDAEQKRQYAEQQAALELNRQQQLERIDPNAPGNKVDIKA